MMAEQRETVGWRAGEKETQGSRVGGKPSDKPTLAEAGIDKHREPNPAFA